MKNNFFIALIILALLTLVNITGGYLNQTLNNALQLNDVFWVTPIHIIFCFLFWLTCLPKIRVDNALRLPLLRVVFWTLLVVVGFVTDNRMATEDFLYYHNQTFCFFINTIGLELNNVNSAFLQNQYFEIFGVHILGVAVYQFAIIKTATLIFRAITKQTIPSSAEEGNHLS